MMQKKGRNNFSAMHVNYPFSLSLCSQLQVMVYVYCMNVLFIRVYDFIYTHMYVCMHACMYIIYINFLLKNLKSVLIRHLFSPLFI